MEQRLILDRYRPLADLGEGGHGSVTLAFDTKMARRVAVKRLPLPPGDSRAGLAEARTAAMLNHPAVVTVFEWDTDPDEAFIIMEHIEGLSLADYAEEFGPLGLDEAAAVLAPVSEALAFAHDNGVLHLDVKPENVLLALDGCVKVADFGISSLTGWRPSSAAGGTPGYMPPEQMRGDEVDERTDVWALAMLAYELLTGANPMASRSPMGSLFKADYVDVPPPSGFDLSLPPALDDILLAALSPEPDDRYGSVRALAEPLLAQLGNPAAGREELRAAVSSLLGEEETEQLAPLGLWDVTGRVSGLARRAAFGALSFALALWGLTSFSLQPLAARGGASVVGAAALLAPGPGLGAALVVALAGILRADLAAGLLAALVAVPYWVAVGRRGRAETWFAFAAPGFAAAGVPMASPLLAGFCSRPIPAALAGAAGFLITTGVSLTAGLRPPFVLLPLRAAADAAAWRCMHSWRLTGPVVTAIVIGTLSWGLASAAFSILAGRATRLAAAAGAAAGAALLVLGYWGMTLVVPALDWPDVSVLQRLSASLILVAMVVLAGPPVRGEPQ